MSKKKRRASFHEDEEEAPTDKGNQDKMFPPDSPENYTEPETQPTSFQPAGTQPQQALQSNQNQMNILSQMMQSFQSMMNLGAVPQQWSSSTPFQTVETSIEPEAVPHDVILPKTLTKGIVVQEGLDLHPLFSKLFLDSNKQLLGGIPKACTLTLTGPAYSGKTRAALVMLVNAVVQGIKVAYVVAEEGFYDEGDTGRNNLFSRLLEIAVDETGLTEAEFRKKYDESYVIIPNQYHLGKTWADFIRDYRYAVEELKCTLTIIDSINMLDPSKLNTVDNLNALKTYNHEKGITCVVIGQVKDSGVPQGGESLFHASEVSIHLYEMTMTSKELAAKWGANYRDSVLMISARSKVCGTLGFPIKVEENAKGLIEATKEQPEDFNFPDNFFE